MRPYGEDLLESDGAAVVLRSPYPKPWLVRQERTLTKPPIPGTVVTWDGAAFEVVAAAALEGEAVRYTLVRWDDRDVIRHASRYDAQTEEERLAARRRTRALERRRGLIVLLGVLAGHLPGDVQSELGTRYGVSAPTLTFVSTIPQLLAALLAVIALFDGRLDANVRSLTVVAYLLVDTALRMWSALLLERPFGSAFGQLAWALWLAVRPRQTRRS